MLDLLQASIPVHASNEDDGTDALLDVLRHSSALSACFVRRSSLLTRHMRGVKRAWGKAKGLSLAPHVLDRIRKHNRDHAVRPCDVIDVTEKKRKVVKGRGKYRFWMPSAILRVCFGKRLRANLIVQRRVRGKRNPHFVVAPTAASTRIYASFYDAGGSYIQKLRNAVAEHYMNLQTQGYRCLRFADLQILELQLDEIETPSNVDFPGEVCHIMVMHVAGTRYRRDVPMKFEFVMPPAMVESTSAHHLFAALTSRPPFALVQLQSTAQTTVLLLNVDSAGSCLKLGCFCW